MKAKVLLLLITVLMFGVSCNDSDDAIPQDPLAGEWHLKNVRGGFPGIDIDYDEGDVIWNFIMDENTLKVETNFLTEGPKSVYQGFFKGVYAVEFEEKDTTRTVLIEGLKFRVLEIDRTKTLVLDDGIAADGFIREFVR